MSTLEASKVFVTGLQVQAQIGVYRHEIGRVQPLIVDVELDVPTDASDRLSETLNYETILEAAQHLASEGHIDLVETFAHRLAARCLTDPRVTRASCRQASARRCAKVSTRSTWPWPASACAAARMVS